jgi:hypothetical protein
MTRAVLDQEPMAEIWAVTFDPLCKAIMDYVYGARQNVHIFHYDVSEFNVNEFKKDLDMDFDYVLENAPFQSAKENEKTNHAIKGAYRNLYQKFEDLGIDLTRPGGTLGSISPIGMLKSTQWGRPNDLFKKLITEMDVRVLKLTGVRPLFNVGSDICYLVAVKSSEKHVTEIISFETVERDISKDFFVPSSLDRNTYSILEKMASPLHEYVMPKFRRFTSKTGPKPIKPFVCIKGMNNRLDTTGVNDVDAHFNVYARMDPVWQHPDADHIVQTYVAGNTIFMHALKRLYYDANVYFGVLNGLFKLPKDTSRSYSESELLDFYGFTSDEIRSIRTFGLWHLK